MSDPADDPTPPERVLGILGAIEHEVSLIRDALTDRVDEEHFGVACHTGRLDGHPVVLARSGVGKVNAALATVALDRAGADALVFIGVAGAVAPGLSIGDIVVGTDAVQHDVDVTALGRKPGELLGEPFSFHSSTHLAGMAQRAASGVADGCQVVAGRIASGDQFIASAEKNRWIYETFGAACAEMEGAAFAQVATRMGLGHVVIRTISDTADGTAHIDFDDFLDLAAPRGLALMRAFVAEWAAA